MIKYENNWNLEKFMNENGGFDAHLITDYFQCSEFSYSKEDVIYAKNNGIENLDPYLYEAIEH